jgi:hypothetical protein
MKKKLVNRKKVVYSPPVFNPPTPPLKFNSDFAWIEPTKTEGLSFWSQTNCLSNSTLIEA